MARRAYISQTPVELEPVEVIKMLGDEIDPYQDGFLEEVKNTNFKLVPEKLPEAIPCTLKVDGSDLEYDVMMKSQPVDPDKHIVCMANENDSDGLKVILLYDIETRKTSFTYRLCFGTWNEVRKFTLFQMAALKGSVKYLIQFQQNSCYKSERYPIRNETSKFYNILVSTNISYNN